jgi:hypothetical protein
VLHPGIAVLGDHAQPIFFCAPRPPASGALAILPDSVSILSMQWKRKIEGPKAARIKTAFAKVQSTPIVWRVSLTLNSPGDNLPTGRKSSALKHIKKTHRLSTIVWQGAICGSACVLVSLAGERRYGALPSIWLFHEVGQWTPEKNYLLTTNQTATERLFQDYFLAAGVSEAWFSRLWPLIQHADYRQTGQNLLDDKSESDPRSESE